ncbi:MAG: hypothetical protein WAV41_03500 [Microgenomates group bacterium]
MNKRLKYLISSLVCAVGFGLFISLPYESRYFGLMAGVVLVVFCIWFGLGILFSGNFFVRMMSILQPALFFMGFGMFGSLLANSVWLVVLMSVLFGGVMYATFLVENVFLVAIGFKTVPLYRAAYTVSLIMILLSAFFAFDTMFSFRAAYYLNTLAAFVIAGLLFLYHYWSVVIELSDDGKNISMWSYVLIPALIMGEMTMVLSFWPAGIFKGSVYLVSAIYVICGLLQADIRNRLFGKTVAMFIWISVAILAAILIITRWN